MDDGGAIIGVLIAIVILGFIIAFIIAFIVMVISIIGFVAFVIPFYALFGLYVVIEFISTNILIALDKIFYPGFHISPLVMWTFWGLVIGAAVQGFREMRIYGRKQKGVLIALAPVALLAILKLISPPRPGSVEVYSASSPVTAHRPPSPPSPVRNNDHSNTISGATSLALGGSHSGHINPGSDVDYFKVQVSKSGMLTVYTTGNLDTRGMLQNSSGTTLIRNLDDGSGNNFKMEQSVGAGTYYIKVESYRSYTGSYTIHASFREQSPQRVAGSSSGRTPGSRQRSSSSSVRNNDYSNTISGAASLALGRSRTGHINPGSDVDYFKVQVSKSGVLTVYTTGNFDTRGVLQNSSGNSLARDGDTGSNDNFKIEQSVRAGTYYIKVYSHNNSVGSYTINASFREQSPQRVAGSSSGRTPGSRQRSSSSSVRNNDHSNTRSGATSLVLGGSRSGHINPGSDVDYFKVQVSKSGVLTVYTTGNFDTRGVLQNSSGNSLAGDDDGGSGNNFKIERSVNTGTYYIKVDSHNNSVGSYTINARLREQTSRVADDHSNTRSGATSLALGNSRSGRINYGDVDYFKVQLRRSGMLTVHTRSYFDTKGTLYNSSGTVLTGNDDGGLGNNFKIEQSVRAGTYYIKVEGHFRSSAGDYTIHADFR